MESADDRLAGLLEATSRTFALTIPYLPEPTRRAVMIAYLLLRIADTLEDGGWAREHKADALRTLARLLRAGTPGERLDFAARLSDDPPHANAAYSRLIAEAHLVFAALDSLPEPEREILCRYTAITAAGMAGSVLAQEDGCVRLTSLQELRDYCYLVAGAVGELLSELFLADWPQLAPAAAALRRDSRAFGEGLQLTNILKDAADDAREDRHYLPGSTPRAQLFLLAREDLAAAQRYVTTLLDTGAPEGVIAFTALPVRLAVGTLRAVEGRGAGAKVPRSEVIAAVAALNDALDRHALGPLLAQGWLAGDPPGSPDSPAKG